MKYVGIDLHKKTISIWAVDQERRKVAHQRLACSVPEVIVDYFRKLGAFQAVVEATASYEWLVRLIEPLVRVSHIWLSKWLAKKCRNIDDSRRRYPA